MAANPPPSAKSGSRTRRLAILAFAVPLTAVLLTAAAEISARSLFPQEQVDTCVSAKGGAHGLPECRSRTKAAEGPWVENIYNECGYRSPRSCGPKPSGGLRVAVIGSSTGGGFLVPQPLSMSGRTSAALGAACGRTVDVQNLAVAGMSLDNLTSSAAEAMRLSPDALVVVVTSSDLLRAAGPTAAKEPTPVSRLKALAQGMVQNSRLLYLAKNFALSREDAYEKIIRAQSADPGDEFATGVQKLDTELTKVIALAEDKAPVVVLFTPRREELVRARVASAPATPIVETIAVLVKSHGATFVNTLDAIPEDIPSARLYYVVNHHMNGSGHAYLATALEDGLRRSVPAFQTCGRR